MVLQISTAPKEKRKTYARRFVAEKPRRKSRRRIAEDVPLLGVDIMTDIFLRLPVDLLHKNFRFQCKEWYDAISSPICKPGIIYMQERVSRYDTSRIGFVEFDGIEMKMRDINTIKADFEIISSCNGLVLLKERPLPVEKVRNKTWGPIILNPVTMESVRVPPCEHECFCHDLVYIPSTKEYKVVDMFIENSTPVFHVRSVGGNWNETCVVVGYSLDRYQMISSYDHMLANLYWNERVFISGILYFNYGSRTGIVSFDICNQTVRKLKLPVAEKNVSGEGVRLVEFNGFLCLVDCVGDEKNFVLDLWILKDINTEEWVKIYSLDGLSDTLGFYWKYILGSLNDGEILVFSSYRHIYAYEIKTRLWKLSGVNDDGLFRGRRHVHVNNFVSIA